MAKVFLSIVLVALTAAAASALTDSDFAAIDNLLFNPFCQRDSVMSILKVCAPVAAAKEVNTFGTDAYSVGASGKVSSAAGANAVKSVFLVAAPSKNVKCTVVGATAEADVTDAITIIKASNGESTTLAFAQYTVGTDAVQTDAIQDTVGVVIKINTAKAVDCAWL